jgi:hypothetical protein
MTSRTPIRNDDAKSMKDSQRPINETVRDLSFQLDEMPRREQAWLRFTCVDLGVAGQVIRAPYAVAAIVVLAVQLTAAAGTTLSAAPWLSVEPVDGDPNTVRITNAFGLPTSGTFDVLVEFVENTTPRWLRTDVTGGAS